MQIASISKVWSDIQIKLLILFSRKPKNANEKILANNIASMYELQIVGNASMIY